VKIDNLESYGLKNASQRAIRNQKRAKNVMKGGTVRFLVRNTDELSDIDINE
jgi:hypothetical protein